MTPTPAEIEADPDFVEVISGFTNYVQNERVRSYNEGYNTCHLTAATQVGEPIDYVELIGKREIEWRAAAEDHVDEIEKLKAELAATIERCAQVAEQHDYSCDAKDIAAAIRKLKDER